MMDAAWTLQYLVPGPQYLGTCIDNKQTSFDALVWQDSRPKPTWADLQAAWPAAQLTITPLPAVLANTLKASAEQLGAAGVTLTTDEATLITGVSVALRDLALWAPMPIYQAQARALISGMPALRAELEQVRQALLSLIPQ